MQALQLWVHDPKPKWLPEGFQFPNEMISQVEKLTTEAQNVYRSIDVEGNGFLRRREFKKAMKKLGVNKFEAKHLLTLIDREQLKVVSIKNYLNAYLFIKCGGLNHEYTDYQGPITSTEDKRYHLNKQPTNKMVNIDFKAQFTGNGNNPTKVSAAFINQNAIVRAPTAYVWAVVYFRNFDTKMYLCSENGKIVCNRTAAGPWEQFTLYYDPQWGYQYYRAIKTLWGYYLCCEDNNELKDNREAIGPWEKFIVDEQYRLVSHQGME